MQQAISAVIVEDEPLALDLTVSMLTEMDNVKIVGTARNGQRGLELIQQLEPDVVFLDIEMPILNGIDLVKKLQADVVPLIVFTTAFNQYAVEAFNLHAVDYLLKPFSEDRIRHAVARVFQRLTIVDDSYKGNLLKALGVLKDAEPENTWETARLAIRENDGVLLVPQHEIDWIDAAGDYICVHSKGETHIMRCTMKQLEKILNGNHFRRIHRSTIVNIDQIKQIIPLTKGESRLLLHCGEELKVSRNYRKEISHLA